jgi:hypothetical protein
MKLLKQQDICYLYYFTKLGNLDSILRNGILPKNKVNERCRHAKSFANEDVQQRRADVRITLSDKRKVGLHDCVPFYFNPDTPTFNVSLKKHQDLIMLQVTASVVTDDLVEIAFTNQNASVEGMKPFYDLKNLRKLDWEIIRGTWPRNQPRNGPDWSHWKRKRQAEFLIFPKVESRFIISICVGNPEMTEHVQKITEQNSHVMPVELDLELFRREDLF